MFGYFACITGENGRLNRIRALLENAAEQGRIVTIDVEDLYCEKVHARCNPANRWISVDYKNRSFGNKHIISS